MNNSLNSNKSELKSVELAKLIEDPTGKSNDVTPLPICKFTGCPPGDPIHSVYKPSLCVIAQGSKEFFLKNERYVYDPANYLIVTAELPLVGQVTVASQQEPYLGLRLDLDKTLVGEVISEVSDNSAQNNSDLRAINVSTLSADFLDAII